MLNVANVRQNLRGSALQDGHRAVRRVESGDGDAWIKIDTDRPRDSEIAIEFTDIHSEHDEMILESFSRERVLQTSRKLHAITTPVGAELHHEDLTLFLCAGPSLI